MDNQVYYYDVGEGRWAGRFEFRITDWGAFGAAGLGPRDRLLAVALDLAGRLPGQADMQAEILCDPDEGDGVARVEVSVRRFGLEIYRLRGHYALDPDGHGVDIHIQHRYGPAGLPWFSKRASARIEDGGYTGRYFMRLLGQPFEGVYRVKGDMTHLAAEYRSEWSVCAEVMDRVGPRRPRRAEARRRWDALLEAARDLEALGRTLDHAEDPKAPFCHVYAYFVRDLAYGLEDAAFDDPDWVVRLGKAFVALYLDAVRAPGDPHVPEAWQVALRILGRARFTVLEELALCMVVHITHDLPHALARVGPVAPDGRSRIADYHRVNARLARAVDPLQSRLSARYNPVAGALDTLFGQLDERLAAEVIEQGRTLAWYDAHRLADPAAHAEAQQDILRRIRAAGRALEGAGPVRRAARRALRRGVRLLRRTPRHPGPATEAFGAFPDPSRRGNEWSDQLVALRALRGWAEGRARPALLQELLQAPASELLLTAREKGRLAGLAAHRAVDARAVPSALTWTMAAEALDTLEAPAPLLSALGRSPSEAEATRDLQRRIVAGLRQGFDVVQASLQAGVEALEGLGLPAEAVISALDDSASGYDPATDVFTARAAALFAVDFDDVAWVVDPARWAEVITQVEDAYWMERDGDRGRVFERVNVFAPLLEHHPLIVEAELFAELRRTADEARVEYRLAKSPGDVLTLDDGFLSARRLGPRHTVVAVEKRLRVVGHPLLYTMLRAYPDGLAALLTHWLHDAARSGAEGPRDAPRPRLHLVG